MLHFSIFIPTFNAQQWLSPCLKSIYSQEYPKENIEVIIVDGGSTDKTPEIIKSYPIRFFQNPRKLAHYAFSIYAKAASADIVIMFAADNEFAGSDWLLTADECFRAHPEISALWGRIISGENDSSVNKYLALIQSEPLSYFTNKNINYYMKTGKYIQIKGKQGRVFKVDSNRPLVWGANGLCLRLNLAKKYFISDKFTGDNDIFQNILEEGNNIVAYIPSLNTIHHHAATITQWTKKLQRNFLQHFLLERKMRNMRWAFNSRFYKMFFIWLIYAGIPVFSGVHAVFLALRHRSRYWFYHPLMNFLQASTYARIVFSTKPGRDFVKDLIIQPRN